MYRIEVGINLYKYIFMTSRIQSYSDNHTFLYYFKVKIKKSLYYRLSQADLSALVICDKFSILG